jgi:septum formation protein
MRHPNLILASKSPRRRYLLEQAGLEFSIIPSDFDESSVTPTSLADYVKRLAEAKAGDISEKHPDSWIIGADTIVYVDNAILGKPGSRAEARTMLRSLSDKTHQVYTGYCICCRTADRHHSDFVKTDVRFKKLTEKEIDWYIASGEPFDKAGAYAIQGLGTFLVRSINGSYTNVVGLPVCEVLEYLIKEGVLELTNDSEMTNDA